MTTTNTYGRQIVEPLTNKSGGSVAAGDVVVIDTSNNDAFTTSTAGAFTGLIGIAQETIANNATGRVLTAGYAPLVNVNASVTRGNFGKSHTVAKQATDAGSSRVAGTFCQFLTAGTTPDAHVFGIADNTSGAGTGTVTTVEEVDGSPTDSAITKIVFPNGTLSIVSHVATYTPSGSGLAHSYVGYNTVGGTTESVVDKTIYAKPFTPASSGLLLSVGFHMKWQEDYTYAGWVGCWADNSGSPGDLIATNRGFGIPQALVGIDLHHSAEADQWLDIPLTSYLTGSTQYWIGFQMARTDSTGTQPLVYYDTSGSDKSATRSNVIAVNGQNGPSWSSTTKKYSIRGDFLS